MDWVGIAIRFVHIAGGSAWLGASIFANLVLVPLVLRQPAERRPSLVRDLILGPERVMIGAALTAAVSGLVLGIGYRGIRSLDALSTPVGLVWLASILLTIAVFAAGGTVTSPAARALAAGEETPSDLGERAAARLRLGFRLELGGIAGVLALMAVLARI